MLPGSLRPLATIAAYQASHDGGAGHQVEELRSRRNSLQAIFGIESLSCKANDGQLLTVQQKQKRESTQRHCRIESEQVTRCTQDGSRRRLEEGASAAPPGSTPVTSAPHVGQANVPPPAVRAATQ